MVTEPDQLTTIYSHRAQTIEIMQFLGQPWETIHWRSSHYAVKQVRNENSNIQGISPNVVKVI